jgi:RTX calcium-binding nonapeptide repeat (4 copies)
LNGGAGADRAIYTSRSLAVSLSLDGVRNDGEEGELDYLGSDVENLEGGAGNDSITGDAASHVHIPSGVAVGNSLYGWAGNDVLDVGPVDAAWDSLYGGEGDDIIRTRDHPGEGLVPGDAAYCEAGFDQAIVDWNDVAIECEVFDSTPMPPLTPPPPPPADTTGPSLRLGGATSQKVLRQRGVFVVAACPAEACTATARGKVRVRGSAKVFKLTRATKQIAQGGKATIKLKLKRSALRTIGRALKVGKRVTAKVTVTAKDAAGNVTTKRRTIRLKR